MKILKLIPALLLAVNINASAQSVTAEKFPEEIVKLVTQKYPDTEDIDWRMKDNLYEVEVDGPDKRNVWMRFDRSGALLAQKEYVSPELLPEKISDIVGEQFKGFKAKNTERMSAAGKTYYQVELKNRNGKQQHLVFSEAGEITLEVPFWN